MPGTRPIDALARGAIAAIGLAIGLIWLIGGSPAVAAAEPAQDLAAAETAAARGDCPEAAMLYERAGQSLEASQGFAHPRTLAVLADLADAQTGAGQHTKALVTAERVLAQRLVTLGERHAETLSVRTTIARSMLGRAAEAVMLAETVVAQACEAQSERHPVTAATSCAAT